MGEEELYSTTGPGAVSRRGFLKVGAAGTAGAVGLGGAGSRAPSAVGDGDAVVCAGVCLGLAVGGAAALGLAAGVAGGAAAVHYFGEDRSDELDGSEETADLHRELRTRLIEVRGANDTVLTQANNNIQWARNDAWSKAKIAAVKARNNEESESAAVTAAEEAIAPTYVQIQKNLLNRGTEWANSLQNIFDLHESDSTLSDSPVIRVLADRTDSTEQYVANPADFSVESTTASLVDGTTYSYKRARSIDISDGDDSDSYRVHVDLDATGIGLDDGSNIDVAWGGSEVDPVETGTTEKFVSEGVWQNIWTSAQDEYSAMQSNVNTFVTNMYQTTDVDQFDPSNWLSASDMADELSSDYESTGYHAYAAAEAAAAGVPGNMDNAMRVTWEEDTISVSGSLWTEWAPADGENVTETETETSTTTEDGTDPAGTAAFNVGETYDPADTNELVLMSYEYGGEAWIPTSDVWVHDADGNWTKDDSVTSAEDWSALEGEKLQVGFGGLDQPFTIDSATNVKTGESVDTVRTESKNTQTADVTVTEEQMAELLAAAEEMRNNDSPGSNTTGGAGGFLPDGMGGSTGMLLLVLAGGAAVLGLQGDN